jgi:pimeloyl-ACP methyl ester carboxylesterase
VLRDRGSEKIFLMGASMGGTAALTAAAELRPSVAGIADLSGELEPSGLNAVEAAKRLRVPVLFVNSKQDEYLSDVLEAYRAASPALRKLVLVAGGSHGVNLLDRGRTPEANRIRATIVAFMNEHPAGD